jgi:hypothetical protein
MADLTAQVITHLLDRVRSDLALLESVGCISLDDLKQIQAKLPTSVVTGEAEAAPMAEVQHRSPSGVVRKTPPPPPTRIAPIQSPRAEAKWDYESNVCV